MIRFNPIWVSLLILIVVAAPASSQQNVDNEPLLPRLANTLAFSPTYPTGIVLTSAFLAGLSSFPVGSSSAAFTYSFRPDLGVPSRDTKTLGPIYVERPYTVGKARLNFGATFEHVTFRSFEGSNLSDGIVIQKVTYRDGVNDIIKTTVDITRSTVDFFVNYGITGSLEIGAVVPVVNVNYSAQQTDNGGRLGILNSQTGTAKGLGDISIRTKYKLISGPKGAAGVLVEFRAPTGDPNNLLGALGPSAKFTALTSGSFGFLQPHVNVSYTRGWGNQYVGPENEGVQIDHIGTGNSFANVPVGAPDEIGVSAGTEVALAPSFTVVGDVLARQIRGIGKLTFSAPFDFTHVNDPIPSTSTALISQPGNTLTVLGTVGIKWVVARDWVISASILFPLNTGGLAPKPSPLVGLDHAF